MAAPVLPTQPLRLAPGPAPPTPDARYWRTFRQHQLVPSPLGAPVTHVSYPAAGAGSSLEPETFAVTSGSRIRLFSSKTRRLAKTITRFGVEDVARSGELRSDGRVVAAGGDSGAVQVFDTSSRAILKTWKEHKQPVWTVQWDPLSLTTLMSTGDDRTVRMWDLGSSESHVTFHGHDDYVRCGSFMPRQHAGLLVTGSYDQTVRLWDQRAPARAVLTFAHAAPVEAVLPMPSGTTVLSAADNGITILDLVAGKPLDVIKSHQKTVTSLALASGGKRLVSGGLDGHLKVFDTNGWRVLTGSKYDSPILSLTVVPGAAPDSDRHLLVGMQSGVLSVKTRLSGAEKTRDTLRTREMDALAAGTIVEHDAAKKRKDVLTQGWKKRLRGLDYDGHGADMVVDGRGERRRSKKLAPWDTALRKARYGPALDAALGLSPPQPVAVLTVLTALVHRSALRAALANRDEASLAPLLAWLARHMAVADPAAAALVTRTASLALELYAPQLGSGSAGPAGLDQLVATLHASVRRQVERAQVAVHTQGMLEAVLAGAG